ncbi:MAG: PIN domain-containing protein [Cyanobacteria bacterium]|jgi:predicted nucleic acid-binding protein|nr:PIN domain-containing protein [Cyanobacteria bacterium GSL.Bin21]
MILCDAGVLLCLVDPTQPLHSAYQKTILSLRKPLISTWSCLTEAMYLALCRGGWSMQKQLWQMLTDRLLVLHEIEQTDHQRLSALMEKYQDRPMDLADATLVLTAEKTGFHQILTLDQDFYFYRINGESSFEVIQVNQE